MLPTNHQVPSGAAIFSPDISTLISNIFQHFIGGKRILASDLRNMTNYFLTAWKYCNNLLTILIIVFFTTIYYFTIFKCVVINMMSFHSKMNLFQATRSLYVVIIQKWYTLNDIQVLFELTKLTMECISACRENAAKMKWTQFECATFECTEKLVVFQSNQHSGKMAPKSSRRSFTRDFKLKAIHYYYDNGKNINQVSNKFKVDRKQIRN